MSQGVDTRLCLPKTAWPPTWKAEVNAVEKYSKTPHKNVQESEFSAEFSHGEDDHLKGANRNSKLGRKGRG